LGSSDPLVEKGYLHATDYWATRLGQFLPPLPPPERPTYDPYWLSILPPELVNHPLIIHSKYVHARQLPRKRLGVYAEQRLAELEQKAEDTFGSVRAYRFELDQRKKRAVNTIILDGIRDPWSRDVRIRDERGSVIRLH
jgi:hypothetical protein